MRNEIDIFGFFDENCFVFEVVRVLLNDQLSFHHLFFHFQQYPSFLQDFVEKFLIFENFHLFFSYILKIVCSLRQYFA